MTDDAIGPDNDDTLLPPTWPPTCSECPYWDTTNFMLGDALDFRDNESTADFLARAAELGIQIVGECRRYPRPWQGREKDREWNGSWPRTSDFDWCGEHPDFPSYLDAWRRARDEAGRPDDDR